MSEEKENITPSMIASIMFASAKGAPKLPALEQVCNDFPTSITLSCRDMFGNKLGSSSDPTKVMKKKDKKAMEAIITMIEKRYNLTVTCMRSPCPDIHRLLKEEK